MDELNRQADSTIFYTVKHGECCEASMPPILDLLAAHEARQGLLCQSRLHYPETNEPVAMPTLYS